MQGARVFEKHVTKNRAWKGTDHSFALEREGFRKFTRDLERVRHMLPPKPDADLGSESVFKKLGKSLTAYTDIKKDEIFSMGNLSGRIFPEEHIPVRESNKVLGAAATRNISKGEAIYYSDVSK